MSVEPVPEKVEPTVAGEVVPDGDPAAVQRRIEGNRAALGRTVEELAARLDWKARLRQRAAQATQEAGATVRRLVGPAGRGAVGVARRVWARLSPGQRGRS